MTGKQVLLFAILSFRIAVGDCTGCRVAVRIASRESSAFDLEPPDLAIPLQALRKSLRRPALRRASREGGGLG